MTIIEDLNKAYYKCIFKIIISNKLNRKIGYSNDEFLQHVSQFLEKDKNLADVLKNYYFCISFKT